ncbi:hypothetical protein [Streptomyces hydrogenans]|uniref:hypothetical protein n=1 Tax=Streptomyces hydrogenans TaxID=1873719 RepID=UPI0035DD19D0
MHPTLQDHHVVGVASGEIGVGGLDGFRVGLALGVLDKHPADACDLFDITASGPGRGLRPFRDPDAPADGDEE